MLELRLRAKLAKKPYRMMKEEVVEEGTQTESDKLLSRRVDNTTYAAINTEVIVWVQSINKYHNFISSRMLEMDDATLTDLANLKKFSEAFIRGCKVWKRGQEE